MNTQIIDFRGLINLDKRIIDQLENYLREKELRLSQQILGLISEREAESPTEISTPILSTHSVKLAEAVEEFIRTMRATFHKKDNWDQYSVSRVVKELNSLFWEYTEALEGCVIELFQQVKQVSVDKWHLTIAEVVQKIYNLLSQRIEDAIWTIRRLEQPLVEFCSAALSAQLPFWKKWNSSILDTNLLRNLKQSYQYLKEHFKDFSERHQEFTRLSYQVEEYLEKMKTFPVLSRLDMHEQNLYVDVFRLLSLIELNLQTKSTLAQESIRSLKYLASVDSIYKVFKIYYEEIYETLFSSSLEYKYLSFERDSPYFEDSLNRLKEKVKDYQHETTHLIATIQNYRQFILKNDSNPYVSSRWGFKEHTVGPEPVSATKLLNLNYELEELEKHFTFFSASLETNTDEYFELEDQMKQNIDKILHEMGQPLISHSLMQNRAKQLLEKIEICNELGSPDGETINYIEMILSKAMREDWKYHVLHEFDEFHEIYRLHLGLCPRFDDPSHAFRNERFHLFFNQIEGWVKKGDLFTHIHEIELDINDMKTYLQDFLAAIQRITKNQNKDPFIDETLQKYRQQLLEYRYIFGKFFSTISLTGEEGQQLRIQFLFVDQYFETIENLIKKAQNYWTDIHP